MISVNPHLRDRKGGNKKVDDDACFVWVGDSNASRSTGDRRAGSPSYLRSYVVGQVTSTVAFKGTYRGLLSLLPGLTGY